MNEFETALSQGELAIGQGELRLAATYYAEAVRLTGSKIAVFGDSHFRNFVGVPDCAQLWLGSITMHRIGRDAYFRPSDFGCRSGMKVAFCFGEIDARNHVFRQAERRGVSPIDVVTDLVDKYFDALHRMCSDIPGSDIFVVTPVPPCHISPGSAFSDLASPLEDRVTAARLLSQSLRSNAKQQNIRVLDFYSLLVGEDGLMPAGYSADGIHVTQPEALVKLVKYAIAEFGATDQLTSA